MTFREPTATVAIGTSSSAVIDPVKGGMPAGKTGADGTAGRDQVVGEGVEGSEDSFSSAVSDDAKSPCINASLARQSLQQVRRGAAPIGAHRIRAPPRARRYRMAIAGAAARTSKEHRIDAKHAAARACHPRSRSAAARRSPRPRSCARYPYPTQTVRSTRMAPPATPIDSSDFKPPRPQIIDAPDAAAAEELLLSPNPPAEVPKGTWSFIPRSCAANVLPRARPAMPTLDEMRASRHWPVVVTPDPAVEAAGAPRFNGSADPRQQLEINGPAFEIESDLFKV